MKTANGVMERARKEGRSVAKRASRRVEEARDFYGTVQDRAREGAQYADEVVHEYPWVAVGAAAAIGFWAGICLNSLVKDHTNSWTYEEES